MNKKLNIIKTVFYWVVSIAFLAIIVFRKSIFDANSVLYNMYEETEATKALVKILKTLVIFDGGLVAIVLSKYVRNLQGKFKQRNIQTGVMLVGNVCKYVAAIAMIILTLAAWGVDTTTLITGAGVLSLIIGLGCQTMVADIVAGIFILFEGDFQVGDVVVISGWRGTVQSIGLRTTKIIDAAGNVKIINNSSITDIVNNTKDLSLAVCDVGIEYNESIERVENILKANLETFKKKIPAISNGPFYKGVASLADSSVVIKIVAQCKEEDKYQTERDLNREIKILFDANNINIPFNQVVINYRDENEQKADLSNKMINSANKFVNEQKELSKGIEEDK